VRGELALTVSALLMSTVSIFVRHIEGDALIVTFLRFSSAFVFIAFVSALTREFPTKIDRPLLLLPISSLATVVFYIYAIQTIEVATAALLLYMAPVYVIPLSLLMGEKIERKTLLALPLGIFGLYMMLSPYGELSFGLIFGLLSGVCYAAVFILSKEARKRHSPLEITFMNLGIGSALLLPYFLLFGSISNVWWVLGLGLVPTAVPFVLFSFGIKFVKVQRAPILALVEPLSASFIGYFYFGEVLAAKQVLGAAMIMVSVFLAWRD